MPTRPELPAEQHPADDRDPGRPAERRLLSRRPATCTAVLPDHQLRVTTVFEVVRAHKVRTAWSDKHAAYDVDHATSEGSGVTTQVAPILRLLDLDPRELQAVWLKETKALTIND